MNFTISIAYNLQILRIGLLHQKYEVEALWCREVVEAAVSFDFGKEEWIGAEAGLAGVGEREEGVQEFDLFAIQLRRRLKSRDGLSTR